jgi:hypothetical protein
MAGAERIRVEIACPDGADYRIIQAELPAGATARDALAACDLALTEGLALGLFGRTVTADTPLADGDRLELYLPLQVDPKTARRQRAAAHAKKSGGR